MHKFKVGQKVLFSAANIERGAAGYYKIVAHLPEENGDHQYRIQSADGPRERVAKESQLSAVEALQMARRRGSASAEQGLRLFRPGRGFHPAALVGAQICLPPLPVRGRSDPLHDRRDSPAESRRRRDGSATRRASTTRTSASFTRRKNTRSPAVEARPLSPPDITGTRRRDRALHLLDRRRTRPQHSRPPSYALATAEERGGVNGEKVAIVTAGGSGMGAAAARKLAADGYGIAILSSSGKGEALANELGGVGVTGSNQSNDDLKRLVDLTMERWGRIDALVNSAGHGPRAAHPRSLRRGLAARHGDLFPERRPPDAARDARHAEAETRARS